MKTRTILVSALFCGLAATTAHTAGFTDPKCAAAKQKAAGKKAVAKLGCYAKAATKPPLADDCITKAETKFHDAFVKADSKGVCVGDEATVEGEVDACVMHVLTDVPVDTGLEKCSAAKMKASGKAAAAGLGCWAKATGKGGFCSTTLKQKCEKDADCALPTCVKCVSGETCNPTVVDPACLDKASTKLTDAFTKADEKGACMGDRVAVGADVDSNCVAPIKNQLPGQPPGCGNHVVEPQFSETCDDGNTVNGDGCPASCHVDPCTPTASTLGTHVTYTGPVGVIIGGLDIFIDYPEGKVNGPVFSNAFGVGNVSNDLGYGFTAAPIKTSGLPSPFMGATYKTCQGAGAAVASDFACKVRSASNDTGDDVPADQVTCTVTIP